jgi:hypothetical protein
LVIITKISDSSFEYSRRWELSPRIIHLMRVDESSELLRALNESKTLVMHSLEIFINSKILKKYFSFK